MQNNENFEEKDNFEIGGANEPPVYKLGRSQKIMAIFLAFFGLFIIILWSVQFKQNITKPFAYKGDTADNATAAQTDELLKTKDTDKDGLYDFDELNTYKTSPYLEDSDSDGISDKAEVDKSTDPNCPTGQNCNLTATNNVEANNTTNNASSSSLNNLNQSNTSGNATQEISSEQKEILKSTLGQNMDAATLRKLMIEQGMDKAALDKISDADLMKSFEETLNSQ
jgi:hypothetical protein